MAQSKSNLIRVRPGTREQIEKIAQAHRLTLIEAAAVMAESFCSLPHAEQQLRISKTPAQGNAREVAA